MDQLKLAYCAGFFDGEGSISIHFSMRDMKNGKAYPRWQEEVKVTQLDKTPLLVFKELFGGYIYKTLHYTINRIPYHRYDWKLASNQAHEFLEIIAPYLILKKEEAEIAVEFGTTFYIIGKRDTRNGVKSEVLAKRKELHDKIRQVRSRRHDTAYAVRETDIN